MRQSCYFILSVKSSGSSIIQRKLAELGSARLLAVTDHAENETLYWVKAASILRLPQYRMEHSEVPFSYRTAHSKLRRLLAANLSTVPPFDTEQQLFDAWTALIQAGEGDLVEKSPHHLYQPTVIDLMERYADQAKDIDVRFIGLVRNPIDTLYSSWRRFGVPPEREEEHWLRAYAKLKEFSDRRPDCVTLVRYEDLVSGRLSLPEALGLQPPDGAIRESETFHGKSLQKWRNDTGFGYTPSDALIALAGEYGYDEADIVNPNAHDWRLKRDPRAFAYRAFTKLPLGIQDGMKAAVKRVIGRA
ncbi:MAG: sulfotransferase [Sphingobium sp.]